MNSSDTSQMQSNPTGESEQSGSSGGIAGAKQRIKTAARETVDQVKSAASSTINSAKEEAAKIASDRKRATAERIGGYSSAIHDSAKSLEEKDPNIAWFTHRAADRLQGVADYVRDRDFRDLRSDAEEMARRHPAVFFGGLFVAGLLVGNLLKASAGATARSQSEDGQPGAGSQGDRSMPNSDRGSDLYSSSTGTAGQGGSGIENQVTS